MIIEDDRSKTMRSEGIISDALLRSQQEFLALQEEEREEEEARKKERAEQNKSDQTIAQMRALDIASMQAAQQEEDNARKTGLGR